MDLDTLKDRQILFPSDTLFTLLEKQAKEFETFGKQMSLDVQNAYKFFIQEQMQHELSNTSDLDNVLGKQLNKFESQSQLIDALTSRIEELENDSIKKNLEIKKLKNEFLDFKKEIKLLFGLENSPKSSGYNNFKKGNLLIDENDSDEFEFIHSEAKYVESLTATTDNVPQNDINNNNRSNLLAASENIRSNERLIAENNQSNEIDIKNERLIFRNVQPKVTYDINEVLPIPSKDQNSEKKGAVVENKKTSIFGSVLFDEYFYNHSTFTTDHSESSTSVKSPSNNKTVDLVLRESDEKTDQGKGKSPSGAPKGKGKESGLNVLVESAEGPLSDHQLDDELEEEIKYNPPQRDPNKNLKSTQKLRDLLLDLKASENEFKEPNKINNLQDYVTRSSSFQQKDDISCLPPITVRHQVTSTSTSSSENKSVQGSQKTPSIIEQIQAEVQYTIARFREQNTRIKQKTFNYLLNQFPLDSLIKYQETTYYITLARDPKRSIKLMIKTALRSELCNKDKRVTQHIEEYVKRKIIPALPPGIKNYSEYEKSGHFSKLSDEKKKRIRKIVTVE